MELRFVMKIWVFMFVLLGYGRTSAQDFEYKNYVYVTDIKSVKLFPVGQPLEFPALKMSGGNRLKMEFDLLSKDYQNFTYRIFHCDQDWTRSDLTDIEYLNGFQGEELRRHEPSRNTFVPYFHYELHIPNKDVVLTKSGNYLLAIYDADDDELPVVTRRFIVYEDEINWGVVKRKSVGIDRFFSHQSMDISAFMDDFKVGLPMRDLSATVMQNGRWDLATSGVVPLFQVGDKLILDNQGKVAFKGGNEFRSLDIRTLDYARDGVQEVVWNEKNTEVIKQIEYPREGGSFLTRYDANGNFILQNKDGGSVATNGDYAAVKFRFKYQPGNEVYVSGAFSDYVVEDDFKMTYNEAEELYETTLIMKQGFYDYMYVIKDPRDGTVKSLEGNYFDANNEYNFIMYYRTPQDRYDRIIGYTTVKYH